MPGNTLPSPSTSLLRACADRDFRLLGDRAGGERFLSPMVQVSECVHLEIHASSYFFRFTMFFLAKMICFTQNVFFSKANIISDKHYANDN